MENANEVVIRAVGDFVAFNEHPEIEFEFTGETLRSADITFGQNERHYNKDWKTLVPTGAYFTELTYPENADALKAGGFDVVSFASNHAMDLGEDVAMNTVGVLKKQGFQVIGIGRNITEARTPAILDRKGIKVGFLAYCSVGRLGSNATDARAGIAPLRAHTLYEQLDYQPGTPAGIVTWTYRDDLEAMLNDIKKVKAKVDVLCVSIHWGLHLTRANLADYQIEAGHAAIDAGADIIFGHHAHILKGIEMYQGKAIVYSMGNFAFDTCLQMLEYNKKYGDINHYRQLYGGKISSTDERKNTMIVEADVNDGKITEVSFLPCYINEKSVPVLLTAKDAKFQQVVDYMKAISEEAGLKTNFKVVGDKVVVS